MSGASQVPLSAAQLQAQTTLAGAAGLIASRFDDAGLVFGHGTESAIDEALWLVASTVGVNYAAADWQAAFQQALDSGLDQALAGRLAALANQRIESRKPLAYLIGEAWFAGLRFFVDESVLVPRSPIAHLIADGFAPWVDAGRVSRVLDLCTGSGCIAIAAALSQPHWQVDASDISRAALAVAERNVQAYDLCDRVRLIESDLFSAPLFARYDLIVSNPPYVDAAEMDARADEFRHEPALGLAAGDDGLDLVRIMLAEAADYLSDDGVLIIEVGVSDEALQREYSAVPFTWLEFEDGSQGVLVIDRNTLLAHQALLAQKRERA